MRYMERTGSGVGEVYSPELVTVYTLRANLRGVAAKEVPIRLETAS